MLIKQEDAAELVRIAREAGKRILPYFRAPHGARKKADRSPVTDADLAAHAYIVEELARAFPGVMVISEEGDVPPAVAHDAPFFLVDPLDGTRSFVRGEPEFSVNIGLVAERRPRFGVIGIPVTGEAYSGGDGNVPCRIGENGIAAPIRARAISPDGVTATRSRSTPSLPAALFLKKLAIRETIPCSSAIKFAYVAEGRADVYPRFGRTMEWDTAAGHAILEAAGGRVETLHHEPLTYGKAHLENPGFLAWGV